MVPHFQGVFLPRAERSQFLLVKNPFYLSDSVARIACTFFFFFSNSREPVAAAALVAQLSVRLCGPSGPCPTAEHPLSQGLSPRPSPSMVVHVFRAPSVKPVIISREFDHLLCQKVKNLLFHSCIE